MNVLNNIIKKNTKYKKDIYLDNFFFKINTIKPSMLM